jgi:hypothetical protein
MLYTKPKLEWQRIGNGRKRLINGPHYRFFPRYNKTLFLDKGFESDGVTGLPYDIRSDAWGWHDKACDDPHWADGTPISAWQAAMIIRDVLHDEGRWARGLYWAWATFAFGCHNARENGWFKPRVKR